METSKKLFPCCCRDAVANRNTLPFDVAGIPFLVMIRPVLSILPALEPALDARLVPTLWKPVLTRPLVMGLRIGLWLVEFLNDVPALAKLFF